MIRGRLYRLARDRRGVTVVEFAFVAPVMLMLMMGIFDLAYQIYAQSILSGALQKAGRDSTIQGAAGNTTAIDNSVIARVGVLMKGAVQQCPVSTTATTPTWCAVRKTVQRFGYVNGEPFTDSNGNGVRDNKECYTDVNGNKKYDADISGSGVGGANDVSVYSFTVAYPRLFPVAGLLGWSGNQTITATTILKNQPYAGSTETTPAVICT